MQDDRLSKAGARNLAILVPLVAAAAFLCCWATFAPPYRWLVDLQVQLTGSYSELIALPVFAVLTMLAAGAVAGALRRPLAGIGYSGAEAVVLLVLAGLSALAVLYAWSIWQDFATRPSRSDPVQVVDLDAGGAARLTNGHVRLIGRAAFEERVTLIRRGRRSTYAEDYVPVVGREPSGSPVRIVATDLNRDAPLEGLLLAGALGARTEYQLRRSGMAVVPGAFVLTTRTRDLEWPVTLAIFLLAPVLIIWPSILYRWLSGGYARERRAIAAGTAGPHAMRPPAPAGRPVPSPPVPARGASAAWLPAAPDGMALLCILRDARVHGSAYMRVDLDGRRACELKPRRYVFLPVPPGEHVVATNIRISLARSARRRLDVRAGEVLVFRITTPVFGTPRLEPVAVGGVDLLAGLTPVTPLI